MVGELIIVDLYQTVGGAQQLVHIGNVGELWSHGWVARDKHFEFDCSRLCSHCFGS